MKVIITIKDGAVTLAIEDAIYAVGSHEPNEDKREVKKMLAEKRAVFEDLWDCGMCRNAGDLCAMHEKMEAEGKKPPKYRHYAEKGK